MIFMMNQQSLGGLETILLLVTCAGAAVAQVRGDSDGPALVHTHALQTFIDAFQQATLAELGHFSDPSLVAAEEVKDASLRSFWGGGDWLLDLRLKWTFIFEKKKTEKKTHDQHRSRSYLESNVFPSTNVAL